MILQGCAWVFGDGLDVDRDILSLDTLALLRTQRKSIGPEELGRHCLESIVPDFANRIRPGDFLVAGQGMGYCAACLDGDPDDPHQIGVASMAILGAGVGAVLCESSNMNFLMNSLRHGLPVIECACLLAHVAQGDLLEVDMARGVLRNLATGHRLAFAPLPDVILQQLRAGGLNAMAANAHSEGQPRA